MKITVRRNQYDNMMVELYTTNHGNEYLMCAIHEDCLEEIPHIRQMEFGDYMVLELKRASRG